MQGSKPFPSAFLLSVPLLRLALVLGSIVVGAFATQAHAAPRLRLAIQSTGTFGWELAIARAYDLDKQAGLELETTELATTEAGKIALIGGGADIILSDWLWAARERSLDNKLVFYPHSTALGAVMAKSGAYAKPSDFIGAKLGVAGGPLDKSWLMLQAWALRQGVDLNKSATIVYGAPPLLAEKFAQGELDAVLEFWTFGARLQSQGFARAVDMAEVERDLGAKGPVIVTGYVFSESFAKKNAAALERFFDMMSKAKKLIADDDAAFAKIAPKIAAATGVSDAAGLALVRKAYRDGIPSRPIEAEETDAAAIYAILARVGGEKLVGSARVLDPGVFYRPTADVEPEK
ncbi:ABC transporter substrate-binding protein [uncultured Rhodoblastus sp.]|uniref:ABC transporter substrate-binding protein n=1 Tax=uncultured Rhodoblastus sp. TaxID=543037 RepID=UPI0025E7BBFE|nr:ABC transporter substrate-binding protein [uncultured Rhodoblastus sp.]